MDDHEIDYAVGTPFRYVLRKLCTITGRSNWFFAHIANVLYPALMLSFWIVKKDLFLFVIAIAFLLIAINTFLMIISAAKHQNDSSDTLSIEMAFLQSPSYTFERLVQVFIGCLVSILGLLEPVALLVGASFIARAATTYFMITHIPRGKGWLARSAAWLKHRLTALRPNPTRPGLSPA